MTVSPKVYLYVFSHLQQTQQLPQVQLEYECADAGKMWRVGRGWNGSYFDSEGVGAGAFERSQLWMDMTGLSQFEDTESNY